MAPLHTEPHRDTQTNNLYELLKVWAENPSIRENKIKEEWNEKAWRRWVRKAKGGVRSGWKTSFQLPHLIFLKVIHSLTQKKDLFMYFAQISTDPNHPWFSLSIIMKDNGVTVYERQAAEWSLCRDEACDDKIWLQTLTVTSGWSEGDDGKTEDTVWRKRQVWEKLHGERILSWIWLCNGVLFKFTNATLPKVCLAKYRSTKKGNLVHFQTQLGTDAGQKHYTKGPGYN